MCKKGSMLSINTGTKTHTKQTNFAPKDKQENNQKLKTTNREKNNKPTNKYEDFINVVKTRNRIARVDGRHIHWVRSWNGGDRYSLIFYDTTNKFATPVIETGVCTKYLENFPPFTNIPVDLKNMGRNIYKTSTYNRNLRVSLSPPIFLIFQKHCQHSVQYIQQLALSSCIYLKKDQACTCNAI